MTEESVSFRHMKDRTQADSDILLRRRMVYKRRLPERILDHLLLLQGDTDGFLIDRLDHSLQTATRAHRDGKDEEYVVCALIHDIGDSLGSYNHADIAAAIVKPFVTPANHWMVEQHNLFQGYYFFHFQGRDRNSRDKYLAHPQYQQTVEFCEKYDGAAFDPDYEHLPLEFFEPMLNRVFAEPKYGPYAKTSNVKADVIHVAALEAIKA
ncbi:HD domain-containing protein [Uliginosibacterium sp. H3]|uniref:HD domain-containing protein n=1 Tax=Uliginosibacterium silvisoli TaxID=3114758 RepID=A0ABU6K5D6_9RHOO|nr:HD domain-containing protein [Uliginosibacterium sp. H3]